MSAASPKVRRSFSSGTPISKAVEEYRAVHNTLPSVRGPDGLTKLFTHGNLHNVPLVTREERAIFTDAEGKKLVGSFEPAYLQFMLAVQKTLETELKPDLDDEGFSRNGVHAKPDNLATPSGYMMNPMSFVATDNAEYRKSLGLRAGYDDDERAIMRELLDIAFSEFDLTDLNLPAISSGGMRRFSHKPNWKADIAAMLFDPHVFEHVLTLVDQNDWIGLIEEYEVVFAYYMQTRLQSDRAGKERIVLDLDYALSGGRRGHAFPADKKVRLHGVDYKTMSAQRARNVQAAPWATNVITQVVATGTMRSLFRRFPKTFHVSTAEEIENYANGKSVVCSDVTEYDRSMSYDAINEFCLAIERWWDPRIAKFIRTLAFAPYYSRPLELDGTRGEWIGDARDPIRFMTVAGNRSGQGVTSLIAKLNKVGDFLFRCHKLGHTVKGRVRQYLEHETVLTTVNNGDDEMTGSTVDAAVASYVSTLGDDSGKFGHYKMAVEAGQVISGFMTLKTDQPKVYKVRARPFSRLEKKICPERSAGSAHRKYWPIGWYDMINSTDNADANPNAGLIVDITVSEYNRYLAPRYGALTSVLTDAMAGLDLQYGALTAIDKAVLEQPEKIHYKYLPEQISPEVYNKLCKKVPRAIFEHIPRNYYNGKIHVESIEIAV